MTPLLPALLLPLFAQTPAEPGLTTAAEPHGQVIDEGELVDYDFGFVFGPAPPDWLLWDEETCRRAGIQCIAQMRPLYEDWPALRLTVEPTALTDPEAYFQRLLEFEALEAVEDSGRTIEFDGQPAWETEFRIPGEPVEDGVMRIWLRDGWAYRLQFTNLQTARPTAAEAFPALAERLRLVGKPRPRKAYPEDPQRGSDWEIDGAGFRSAAYGFALEPGPAWRVLAGVDADQVGDWLDAVFLHADGREVMVYGVSVPPEDAAIAADQWLERRRLELQEAGIEVEQVILQTRFGDLQALRRTEGWIYDETAVEAVLDLGPLLCVLDGWQEAGLAPSAESAVVDLAESFRLLDAAELQTLRERLQAPGGAPARVGGDWSLRHGVYGDFQTGMRLAVPAGWRARTAAGPWGEPDLSLQHPELELTIDVYRYEAGEDASLTAMHDASLEGLLGLPGAEFEAPVSLSIDGARGLKSVIRWLDEDGAETSRQQVCDLIHAGRGLEIWVSSMDAWAEEADAAVEAVFTAMQFPEDGLPPHRAGDDFHDLRFGWALQRPDAGWRGTVETDSIGEPRTEVVWRRGPLRAVVAAMPATTLNDPWWGLSDVVETVRPDLALRPLLTGNARNETLDWAGLLAQSTVLADAELQVLAARCDGIAYVMVLSGPVEDPALQAFRERFRLLSAR